ncbi:hypothetical protein AB0L40_08795 [Patulibacter sp. NPDC049589]|uniref:hypothetical protein n=1 Tax=Patulibacter sp. NPDC049589 TaxID=3154731 RepID=UPI00343481E6
MPTTRRPRSLRPVGRPRLALLAAVVVGGLAPLGALGCGGGDGGGAIPGAPAAKRAPTAPAADRQADGEGIAKLIVDGFDRGLVGCDFNVATTSLRRLSALFEPGAESGLLGQYSEDEYHGPTDGDPSAYSAENPPPDRATELRDLLSMFPGGRFAARQVPDYDILEWPFNYDPENAEIFQALDGSSYATVCHAGVAYLAGSDPARLRASYRRAGSDASGRPIWLLSFPVGSDADHSLQTVEARELVVADHDGAWRIASFRPHGTDE